MLAARPLPNDSIDLTLDLCPELKRRVCCLPRAASPPADGYVSAENTKYKETAAYEEVTNYVEPMNEMAGSTKDFYDYTSGMMCAGEPIQAIEGEATMDSCRVACDQFFGCNSFTYSTNVCMLYNDCPNETMVAYPETWSGTFLDPPVQRRCMATVSLIPVAGRRRPEEQVNLATASLSKLHRTSPASRVAS